jgi:hypothetical protein
VYGVPVNATTETDYVKLVNNTSADIRYFERAFLAAVDSGGQLPEELRDLFSLRIISDEKGRPRGIIDFL